MNDSDLKQPDDTNPDDSSSQINDSKTSALQEEFRSADGLTQASRSKRIPVIGIIVAIVRIII